MHVSIVGAGSVGEHLGRGLAAAGHAVTFGVRDPAEYAGLVDVGDEVTVTGVGAAVDAGEVVVLAVPGGVVADVAAAHADALAGRPVLDTSNTLDPAVVERGSLADDVAAAAPDASVAKAFNTVGAEWLVDPVRDGQRATMLVAGDPDAREVGLSLAADLGFDPVSAGDLAQAGHLEHLARLWIHLAREHGRDIAFSLLR